MGNRNFKVLDAVATNHVQAEAEKNSKQRKKQGRYKDLKNSQKLKKEAIRKLKIKPAVDHTKQPSIRMKTSFLEEGNTSTPKARQMKAEKKQKETKQARMTQNGRNLLTDPLNHQSLNHETLSVALTTILNHYIIHNSYCAEFMKAEQKIHKMKSNQFEQLLGKDREGINHLKYFEQNLKYEGQLRKQEEEEEDPEYLDDEDEVDYSEEASESSEDEEENNCHKSITYFEVKGTPEQVLDFTLNISTKQRRKVNPKSLTFSIVATKRRGDTSYYMIHEINKGHLLRQGRELVYIRGVKKISPYRFVEFTKSVDPRKYFPITRRFERVFVKEGYALYEYDHRKRDTRYFCYRNVQRRIGSFSDRVKNVRKMMVRRRIRRFIDEFRKFKRLNTDFEGRQRSATQAVIGKPFERFEELRAVPEGDKENRRTVNLLAGGEEAEKALMSPKAKGLSQSRKQLLSRSLDGHLSSFFRSSRDDDIEEYDATSDDSESVDYEINIGNFSYGG